VAGVWLRGICELGLSLSFGLGPNLNGNEPKGVGRKRSKSCPHLQTLFLRPKHKLSKRHRAASQAAKRGQPAALSLALSGLVLADMAYCCRCFYLCAQVELIT